MGYDSIAMVLVSLSVAIFTDIIYIFYVFYFLRQKFYFKGFKSAVFKSLFSYTIFIAINLIIDQINWNVDKLLLGRFSRNRRSCNIFCRLYAVFILSACFSCNIKRIYTTHPQDSLLCDRGFSQYKDASYKLIYKGRKNSVSYTRSCVYRHFIFRKNIYYKILGRQWI